MKSFIKKIGFFFSSVIVLMLCLIWLTNKMVTDSLKNSMNISVLVLGDSHTQNGLNIETRIPNSLNLSASAESYYFCYNKLKFFVDNGQLINKVILGFGAHSLSKSLDTVWLMSEDNFIEKFRTYSPFLDFQTIPLFFNQVNWGPFTYFKLLPALVYQPFYALERKLLLHKLPYIGGFDPNNKQLKIDTILNSLANKQEVSISENQLYYLNKIKDLCLSKNIEFILLNMPVYSGEKINFKPFVDSSIKLLDYGDLWKGNEYYFADYVHLNEKGANEFSEVLAEDLKWNKKR
jgi:hypothetical protein